MNRILIYLVENRLSSDPLTVLERLESFEVDIEGDSVGELSLGIAHDHIDYVD